MQDFDKIFRLTGRVEDILVLKPEDDNMYGSKITRSERTAYRKKVIQAIRSKADSGFKGVNYSTYDEKAWQNLINEVDEALSAGERHFGNGPLTKHGREYLKKIRDAAYDNLIEKDYENAKKQNPVPQTFIQAYIKKNNISSDIENLSYEDWNKILKQAKKDLSKKDLPQLKKAYLKKIQDAAEAKGKYTGSSDKDPTTGEPLFQSLKELQNNNSTKIKFSAQLIKSVKKLLEPITKLLVKERGEENALLIPNSKKQQRRR